MSTVSTKERGSVLKWAELLNESVHTSDDQDIGDIEAVDREFVVVKRGFVNVHRYFIPASKIEGWDGNVLWLKTTEDEVRQKYQNDEEIPEPSRYLTKDFENYYNYDVYPPIGWIPVKYAVPPYVVPAAGEQPVKYRCDLCGTTYRDDWELAGHVNESH